MFILDLALDRWCFNKMYQQQSKLQTLLLTQVAVLILSIANTFLQQYTIFIMIIYFIVLMSITSYSTMKRVKPTPEDTRNPIFREQNAMKIAMYDKELTRELSKQMKALMASFLTLPVAFVMFPLYTGYISPIVRESLSSVLSEIPARFINYIIMYETIFMILTGVRVAITRKVKMINIMLPQQYVVYRKGVLANNRMFIRFTEDHCFKYNPKRRFVEIVSPQNPGFKLRLYSEEAGRLKDKLLDLKIMRECEEV